MTHRSEQAGWFSILQAASTMREIEESAERIRCQEVSRALGRMDLSPEEETAVEQMSRSLVDKLLRGPISEVVTYAEAASLRRTNGGRRSPVEDGDRHAKEPPGEVDDPPGTDSLPVRPPIRRTSASGKGSDAPSWALSARRACPR